MSEEQTFSRTQLLEYKFTFIYFGWWVIHLTFLMLRDNNSVEPKMKYRYSTNNAKLKKSSCCIMLVYVCFNILQTSVVYIFYLTSLVDVTFLDITPLSRLHGQNSSQLRSGLWRDSLPIINGQCLLVSKQDGRRATRECPNCTSCDDQLQSFPPRDDKNVHLLVWEKDGIVECRRGSSFRSLVAHH